MLCQLCNKRKATVVISTMTGDGIGGLAAGKKTDKHFCQECILSPTKPARASATKARPRPEWKQVAPAAAKAYFQLTGESVLHGATIPTPPSSRMPTNVRVSHSNSFGRVDSDIFMRLGDPKKPLDAEDFDTVSDWRKAELVEDLLWNDKREEWVSAAKAKGGTSIWCGTYEVEFHIPKGHHQIDLKVISRVQEVCSIVLSNWKVYVR